MIKVDVTRNLIGLEDLLVGTGTQNQTRASGVLPITKINGANLPYDADYSMQQKIDALQAAINSLPAVVDGDGNLLTGLVDTSAVNLGGTHAGRIWRKTISAGVAEIYYGTILMYKYNPTTGNLVLPAGTDYIAADAVVTAAFQAADVVVTNAYTAAIAAVVATLKTGAFTDTGTTANKIVKLNGSAQLPALDGSLLTGVGVPVGTVSYTAGATPDTNYLECNGAAISRATYATLFTRIGTTYGVGNGTTTFNIPELRGEFIRTLDSSRGIDISRVLGSYQAEEVKQHTHTGLTSYIDDLATGGPGRHALIPRTGGYTDVDTSISTYGGAETRPRNIALLAQIKVL